MKIFLLATILFFFLTVFVALGAISATGFIKIPIFSTLFYSKKVADFGIEPSPKAAKALQEKLEVTPLFNSAILPEPTTIEASDVEITSLLSLWAKNNPDSPFQNPQVKFTKGKVWVSARIIKPIEGDVMMVGKLVKFNEKSLDVELEKMYLGNLPLPKTIRKQIEDQFEKWGNQQLASMRGLKIEKLEILDGKIRFSGLLPNISCPNCISPMNF
jgi:hypothetical protein